jgi:enoyl-CoA hydratase
LRDLLLGPSERALPNFQTIKLEVNTHIATITLNRPDKGNAFNMQQWLEYKSAFEHIGSDSSVRVCIVRGEGKNFSTGIYIYIYIYIYMFYIP